MTTCPYDPSTLSMARMSNRITRQLTTFDLKLQTKTIRVAHNQSVVIGEVKGKGYIANLWMTFPGWFWQHWNTEAPISQSILKTLIVRIYFDGADYPAIEAPAGDLFGIGLCEVSNYTSRYMGMSSGGFFMKFPMPFRKDFRVEIENKDAVIDTDIFMNVLYQLDDAIDEDMGYFHAQFHTGKREGAEALEIARFDGRGRFAGCALSMQGFERGYMSFLEAPEYTFVDEDWDQPRTWGTGLEDYFLGGWYFREGPFAGPLHGVPIKDSLNASIAMYRIHDDDAVHFQKRFSMRFVNPWEPARLKPYVFSSVAYAYLDSPVGQGPAIPPRDELLCFPRIRNCDHQSIP